MGGHIRRPFNKIQLDVSVYNSQTKSLQSTIILPSRERKEVVLPLLSCQAESAKE